MTCSTCDSDNDVTPVFSGSFTDGLGKDANNVDRSWVINSLIKSRGTISISFPSFNTEDSVDYVYIYSCQSTSGETLCGSPSELARLSGSVSPNSSWTSTTGIVMVKFTKEYNNDRNTHSAFVASWRVLPCKLCPAGTSLANCRAVSVSPLPGSKGCLR